MNAPAHPLTWASPRPLWRGAAGDRRAPTILRFADDEFMEQLLGILATDPARLDQHVARWESWRDTIGAHATDDYVERVALPAPVKGNRLATRLARSAPVAAPEPVRTMKLYQPAHQRYYVAAATLACATPGLPDRKPAGSHERLGFVLRRLMPPEPGGPLEEYAYVKSGEGGKWQRVAETGDDPAVFAPGEELLPVFPLSHLDPSGLRRTLWGGLIPVGRREAYLAVPIDRTVKRLVDGQIDALKGAAPAEAAASKLARTSELRLEVIEPWKALIAGALAAAGQIATDTGSGSSAGSRQAQVRTRNLQFQTQSWLLTVDLMAYLGRHLKAVADRIVAGSAGSLSGAKRDLYNFLATPLPAADLARLGNGFVAADVSNAGRPAYLASLAEALQRSTMGNSAAKLDAVETFYFDTPTARDGSNARAAWPDFHFLLAGVGSDGNGGNVDALGAFRPVSGITIAQALDPELEELLSRLNVPGEVPPPAVPTPFDTADLDRLTALIVLALDEMPETTARALPFAHQLARNLAITAGTPDSFHLRFVHLNEDCGPVHPPVLSGPSDPFELASFFDVDAPARPVRISLPMDTSPAGLRKHARGTAFVLSNMLCGQLHRAKKMGFIDLVRQVLPWPLHKDIDLGEGCGCKNNSVDIGMICSLSIPIITICALILLTIIVSLLDFIFRWIPWFTVCFPVPRFKGKAGGSA